MYKRQAYDILSDPANQKEIEKEYPLKENERRNSGYALDLLLDSDVFGTKNERFNFCKLVAGSEGTLTIATEIKLNLVPVPPKEKGLVCIPVSYTHLDVYKRQTRFFTNNLNCIFISGERTI